MRREEGGERRRWKKGCGKASGLMKRRLEGEGSLSDTGKTQTREAKGRTQNGYKREKSNLLKNRPLARRR